MITDLERVQMIYGAEIDAAGFGRLDLIKVLSIFGKVYVQGGAVRDCALRVLESIPAVSRDVDIVVEGYRSREELYKALIDYDPVPNSFGNPKVTHNGIEFDIWRLEDNFGARSIGEMLEMVTTTLDAIAYDIKESKLIDTQCIASVRQHTVDLTPLSQWCHQHAAHNIAHIAKVAGKTGYELSTRTRKTIAEYGVPGAIWAAKALLARHYPMYEVEALMSKVDPATRVEI